MKIFLNGAAAECAAESTVANVIQCHGLAPETTLVEHNGVALHRREWDLRPLQENDRLEILQVAAGG
jgi:sulfur carrier protein